MTAEEKGFSHCPKSPKVGGKVDGNAFKLIAETGGHAVSLMSKWMW